MQRATSSRKPATCRRPRRNAGFLSGVIAGPRTEEQWDAYVPAIEATLDADDEAFIDSLVPPGHASTPGYTDPAYPIEGRQVR